MASRPTGLNVCDLLTVAQVARALHWRQADCGAWLDAQGLARRRPDGCGPKLYRWGDVLRLMPTEQEKTPELVVAASGRRKLRRA
jgi:hypothetical protein